MMPIPFPRRRPSSARSSATLAVLVLAAVAPAFGATPSAQRIAMDAAAPAVIDATPVIDRWGGSGFMPVRVRIENRSGEAAEWTFSFGVSRGWSGSQLNYETRLGAGAGEVVEKVVMVPGPGGQANGSRTHMSLTLDGPGARGYGAGFLHNSGDATVPTATTPALESPVFSALHGAPGVKADVTAVEPGRWPADWRVWSPFARVVLDERAYAALDGARRAALHDWVAMGGVLDIYPTGAPRPGQKRHGLGVIRRAERTLGQEAGLSPKPEVSLPRFDFGYIGGGVSLERQEMLRPQRGVLGVAIFLVVFGLLIGPANLFWFARSGRRQRLFVTVPALSLGASVLLAGYIVVEDGFGGEGAAEGLVLLLPDENQAVVTQRQFSRTGVLVSGGFELPGDVALAHIGGSGFSGDEYRSHYDSDSRPEIYSRSDAGAGGDWFASRRQQIHELRRLTPTRARVELVGTDAGGAPVVQSSVGAVLTEFRHVDADGVAWEAAELAPGQRVTLRRSAARDEGPAWRRGLFTARGGAAEGLAPIKTLDAIRWDEPKFNYAGPLVGARTP